MTETPVLNINKLSKNFNGVQAVSGVSFQLKPGEKCLLMGRSGSGKSTLLRLIAGFETPDEGEIFLNGILVTSPDWISPPWTRGIGMVFQGDALFPHLTVSEQISIGIRDLPEKEKTEKVLKLSEKLSINSLLTRFPHQLSGGEARRVAIARVLIDPTRLLLLDEPFAHLDENSQKEVAIFLRKFLYENGTTCLIVTHESEIAQILEIPARKMDRGVLVP